MLALLVLPACEFDSYGLPAYKVDAWAADRATDRGAPDLVADLSPGSEINPGHDLDLDLDLDIIPGPDSQPATDGAADSGPLADSATSDAAPSDAKMAPPDKPPPTCKILFSKVKGYHLCAQQWNRCKFFREEKKKKSCNEVCGKHQCLNANHADSKHKCKVDTTTCASKNTDSNCTCSRF